MKYTRMMSCAAYRLHFYWNSASVLSIPTFKAMTHTQDTFSLATELPYLPWGQYKRQTSEQTGKPWADQLSYLAPCWNNTVASPSAVTEPTTCADVNNLGSPLACE